MIYTTVKRYCTDSEDDVGAFKACVKQFQSVLPRVWGERLLPHAEAQHENTLGCIGTLSFVLTRAALIAQAVGGWSLDCLRVIGRTS